jgi:hypothetical protein
MLPHEKRRETLRLHARVAEPPPILLLQPPLLILCWQRLLLPLGTLLLPLHLVLPLQPCCWFHSEPSLLKPPLGAWSWPGSQRQAEGGEEEEACLHGCGPRVGTDLPLHLLPLSGLPLSGLPLSGLPLACHGGPAGTSKPSLMSPLRQQSWRSALVPFLRHPLGSTLRRPLSCPSSQAWGQRVMQQGP